MAAPKGRALELAGTDLGDVMGQAGADCFFNVNFGFSALVSAGLIGMAHGRILTELGFALSQPVSKKNRKAAIGNRSDNLMGCFRTGCFAPGTNRNH
jgi:hypothetical protein